MKRASEAPFPYGWPGGVCYLVLVDGAPQQIRGRDGLRAAVTDALVGEVTIYAAWPGQFRTDLFVIDRPELLAEAIGVEAAA